MVKIIRYIGIAVAAVALIGVILMCMTGKFVKKKKEPKYNKQVIMEKTGADEIAEFVKDGKYEPIACTVYNVPNKSFRDSDLTFWVFESNEEADKNFKDMETVWFRADKEVIKTENTMQGYQQDFCDCYTETYLFAYKTENMIILYTDESIDFNLSPEEIENLRKQTEERKTEIEARHNEIVRNW